MEKFINSGRFIGRKSFLEKNPTEELLSDCTDIVRYADGSYIQVLKSGLFYVNDTFSSESLDEAERELLKKISK